MDIYAAQKMFGRGRTFDRVDVGIRPDASLADAQREISGCSVRLPGATAGHARRQAELLLRGFSTMVNISSVFALFVGMFHHLQLVCEPRVAQRRSEVGILRALGATQRQVGLPLPPGEPGRSERWGSVIGVAMGVGIRACRWHRQSWR
jgi:putative ABC transport system permease protein